MSPPTRKKKPRPSEGERFLELYGRYRDVVREELEDGGLSAESAERLVGAVFERLSVLARAERSSDPGAATIRSLAREVSAASAGRARVPGPVPPLGGALVSGG